ncbi:hypothetical protein EYB45_07320 [Erythrobacteraceae bacterium CFH 75059]|uniref:hypothetical protein n=1 Tax=Qipengyuania thermophila TaxID=2509361 RepID=UPI00101F20E9|nr:hypothetical protein [Qipengyuania thermophila]TCD05283.1 hypothetical protein EYB45_07320 [Erythrobacteraceae bacterium CFH 75059]
MLIALLSPNRSLHAPAAQEDASTLLLLRQAACAAASGCGRVLLVNGTPGQARLIRERTGLTCLSVAGAHAIADMVTADQRLMVFASDLWIADELLARVDARHNQILTANAAAAIPLGFERIDARRAWAGIMTVPGTCVAGLAALPPDSDAASALLRLALIGGTPDAPVDPWLELGQLHMPRNAGEVAALAEARLQRLSHDGGHTAPLQRMLRALMLRAMLSGWHGAQAAQHLTVALVVAGVGSLAAVAVGSPFAALLLCTIAFALATLRSLARASVRKSGETVPAQAALFDTLVLDLVFATGLAGALLPDAGGVLAAYLAISTVVLIHLATALASLPPAVRVVQDRVLLGLLASGAYLTGLLAPAVALLGSALLIAMYAYRTGAHEMTTGTRSHANGPHHGRVHRIFLGWR